MFLYLEEVCKVDKKCLGMGSIMDIKKLIENVVNKKLHISVREIVKVGKGASGSVYRVKCNGIPKIIAVKISSHPELMLQEFEMLSFLKEKTESKIPNVYFFEQVENIGVIGMEYISGICGTDKSIPYSFRKKHLAESIVNNLLVIQKAHNDKFGVYNHAVYDTWQQYYSEFAKDIYTFSKLKYSKQELDAVVMKAVALSYRNLDIIFSEEISPPTLIHGDYWMPNFIIDKKSMELLAVVDPFNVMWADSEYELFALTAGAGKKLRLYETYKRKVKVSKYCDLKLELYALYSELLWYKKQVPVEHSYLRKRAKRLLKEMKKHKMI